MEDFTESREPSSEKARNCRLGPTGFGCDLSPGQPTQMLHEHDVALICWQSIDRSGQGCHTLVPTGSFARGGVIGCQPRIQPTRTRVEVGLQRSLRANSSFCLSMCTQFVSQRVVEDLSDPGHEFGTRVAAELVAGSVGLHQSLLDKVAGIKPGRQPRPDGKLHSCDGAQVSAV